jgi:hydroxymethylpyrimidine/phosphomethylpyrimidine kinase
MILTEDVQAPPVILSIAGFDPSGGAGIIVDVQTIAALGCKPVAAITSLTFQNSHELFGAIHESAESLRAQILPILSEHSIAAVKIGMMPTANLVFEIAQIIIEGNLPAPVVDPVIQSSSGYPLTDTEAVEVLLRELLPVAGLITPNIPEAEKLTGVQIENEEGMRAAAEKLCQMGARAVLVKGGHLNHKPGAERQSPTHAIDVLNDQGRVTILRGEWIDAPPLRGTGCMLSSAVAAALGKGLTLEDAVTAAKDFVSGARSSAERSPRIHTRPN